MGIGEWVLVLPMLFIGVVLIIKGCQRKKKAASEIEYPIGYPVGNGMICCGLVFIILMCAVILLAYLTPHFPALQNIVSCLDFDENDKTQESQTEVEDVTSQPAVIAENIAYANGEVTEKLDNRVILVSVHEEKYKILVEQDVYDSLEKGDAISCIAYLDEDNNIVGVNYIAN